MMRKILLIALAAAFGAEAILEVPQQTVVRTDRAPKGELLEETAGPAHAKNTTGAHHKNEKELKKGGTGGAKGMLIYGGACLLMTAIVTFMFYPMGALFVVQVLVYLGCLGLVKIVMKSVYSKHFKYPVFVTSLHLLVSSAVGFMILLYRYRSQGTKPAVPTMSEFFCGVLPIALTFGFSIGAENSSLTMVSAAFSEVIAAMAPCFSAFLTIAMGMDFHWPCLIPIAVVIGGSCVSVAGEMKFSMMGLTLLLLSGMLRAGKAVMQQKLMTGATKEKFDPVTLMAWSCLASWAELAIYSACVEGMGPFRALAGHGAHGAVVPVGPLAVCLAMSAVVALALNLSALFVIRQLGAVGMQMIAQMKSILTVAGGIVLLGETFTGKQKLGFGIVLAGVYGYSVMKRKLDERKGLKSTGH